MTTGYPKCTQVITLRIPAGVGASSANTTILDYFPIPVNMSLMDVKAIASGVSGSPAPTIDLFLSTTSATVLSTAITISAANTVYSGAIAAGDAKLATPTAKLKLSAKTALSMRVVTASGGSSSTPSLTLLLKIDDPRYASGKYFIQKLSLPGDTGLSNGVAETTIQDHFIVPCDCEFVYGCCIGRDKAGIGSDPEITIYNNTTKIATNVTIAANNTVYDITPATASTGSQTKHRGDRLTAGSVVSMRCNTAATAGAIKTPAATLLFRKI